MTFVDTHCHLDFEAFDADRKQLIKKMREKNIIALTNTLNPKNYEETKEKFQGIDNVFVCPGLYPQDAEKISDNEFEAYLKQIESEKDSIKAIGETGMDKLHTTDDALLQIQENRFRKLIELAIKIDKPIIIHTRKQEEKVLNIIREYVEEYDFRKFHLHCFTGKKKLIKDIKELKVYCSIPLIVKNTESFQILVKELPTNQLLVETDSPFLHPSKERNSPLSVPLVYEEIARIKGYDTKEIENIIYRNFQKLTM